MSGGSRKTVLQLGLLAVGMFGFAFALVPLYNIFCEITGLNGRTAGQAALLEEISQTTAEDRDVTLEFLGSVARGLAWEFHPNDAELVVTPGELNVTTYYARNRTDRTIVAQAVPSVSPGRAAQYVKKIECFCFEPQEIPAGGELEMPVRFIVDSEMPESINELTLSYRMFPVEDAEHQHVASNHDQGQHE